jgi:hypothetical protein
MHFTIATVGLLKESLPVLHIILCILSLGSGVRSEDRLEIHVCSCLWMLTPNPCPDQDKTARHESISRLRSSAFVHNEYFGKIRCELRSEQRQKDRDGIYSIMSRCLFLGQGKN